MTVPPVPAEYRFGRHRLDPVRRVLRVDGVPARVGSRAIDVLLVLIQARHAVVSKDELLDRVWPGLVVEENNLQVQVSVLRKLLGPQTIATVPGRGYQFIADLDSEETAGLPRPAPPPAATRSLPAARGTLIGRDADLAEACDALARHALLTIVGPGGIGKTRLALAAAESLQQRFGDGACWIDLSALVEDGEVAAAVAASLGVQLPRTQPAPEALAGALREQQMLIVLDNCEHLLSALATLVPALLRAAGVRVLATSQAPLRLDGEQVLRLQPLAMPSGENGAPDVAACGSVQLFVERAAAVQRGFALKPDTAAAVADICRRLDGLPLAIELAAARLPLLGLTGLRERLDERLQLLTRGAQDAPARQQTLRATLEWSHALLAPAEQRLFRRLAVFNGGFSLALAQDTLVEPGEEPWTLLDQLGVLVDRSLVVATGGAQPRYRLLEAARDFAQEQLAAAGERESIERRRAWALERWLQQFDDASVHEERLDELITRVEDELENLKAALRWALSADSEPELAVSLLASSQLLWIEIDALSGSSFEPYRVARQWLDRVPPLLAARFRLAFQSVARARMLKADVWAADTRAALQTYREHSDRLGLYRALCALGSASRAVITAADAAVLLAEAERIEDPSWSPRLRARRQLALEWWNDMAGDFDAARAAGLRHVELARASGTARVVPALSNLADTEIVLGNTASAIALCREAIALAERFGRPAAAAHAWGNMVPALLSSGDFDAADAAIRSGRQAMVRSLGTALVLLMPLASLMLERGEAALAARLVGCADRRYADGGFDVHPPERRMREAIMQRLAARYEADELSALLREGAQWSEAEAFERAGMARAPSPIPARSCPDS